jgi:hypothetical protein
MAHRRSEAEFGAGRALGPANGFDYPVRFALLLAKARQANQRTTMKAVEKVRSVGSKQ